MNAQDKGRRVVLLAVAALLLSALACSLSCPPEKPERPSTAPPVAEDRPTTEPAQPAQPVATSTPVPDISGPDGCTLNAAFVEDVTIPDGKEIPPDKSFTKTWRMRNTGTCPWKPGTKLVFVSGDQMGGSAAVPLQPVAPGAGTTISVDLVAPSNPGTYKGNWQLQSPEGTKYGHVIYVEIVVPAAPAATSPAPSPTATAGPPPATSAPQEQHVTIPLDETNSYSSDGYDNVRPGDDPSDSQVTGFMSWDIQSYIPAGAEIVSAEIVWGTQCFRGGDVGDCTGTRRPFRWKTMDRLGYLEIQHYYYGTVSNPPTMLLDPSIVAPFHTFMSQPTGTLDVTDKVADDFDDGQPFQLRLAFEIDTYDSGIGNGIVFVEGGTGPNRLEVTYIAP